MRKRKYRTWSWRAAFVRQKDYNACIGVAKLLARMLKVYAISPLENTIYVLDPYCFNYSGSSLWNQVFSELVGLLNQKDDSSKQVNVAEFVGITKVLH